MDKMTNNMKKRVMLFMVAVLATLAAGAQTDGGDSTTLAGNHKLKDTYYISKGFYVGGVEVHGGNYRDITGSNIKAYDTSKPYKAVYDNDTRTLTLTNVKIERTGSGNRAIQNNYCGGLTIVFDGPCYLSAKDQGAIKMDVNTTLTCAGGRYDEPTYIYGGSEDGLCAFQGATCTIKDANLYIEGTNSDAIWADSHQETLKIEDSHVVAVSKKQTGRALYNYKVVNFVNSYVCLRAPVYTNALTKVTTFQMSSNMHYRVPGDLTFQSNGDNGYLYSPSQTYNTSVGYVMENHLADLSTSNEIPDQKLRTFIASKGYNSGSYLYYSDIEKVASLDVSNLGLSDPTGIGFFHNLEVLNCSNNSLTSLNTNSLPKLKVLNCGYNKLTSLELHDNTKLETIYCNDNQLTTVSINSKTPLRTYNCAHNKIRSVDVTFFGVLMANLNCADNNLLYFNIRGCSNLAYLDCSDNNLGTLGLSGMTGLVSLKCSNTGLTSLDVSSCGGLKEIYAYGNKLSGTAMTDFVNSLPTRSGNNVLRIVNHADDNEGNLLTNSDRRIAFNKGWSVNHNVGRSTPEWDATSQCIEYDFLYLGGKKLSSCLNPEGTTFDHNTSTLTLNNANLKGRNIYSYGRAGIYSNLQELKIHLVGTNTVEAYGGMSASSQSGMQLTGDNTIDGGADATLNVAGLTGINYYGGTLTLAGNVKMNVKGYGTALRDGTLRSEGTLVVKGGAELTASTVFTADASPIFNWGKLDLQDNHAIVEPRGAYYKNKMMYDADGSVMRNGTVKIAVQKFSLGDVNQDGEINSADVVAIYNYIIEGTASGILKDNADVDGDGEVGTADVVAVYNIIINGN